MYLTTQRSAAPQSNACKQFPVADHTTTLILAIEECTVSSLSSASCLSFPAQPRPVSSPPPPPRSSPPSLARRFHPQFRDKNRRDIGKSQSMWTDSKMETAGSLALRRATPPPPLPGAFLRGGLLGLPAALRGRLARPAGGLARLGGLSGSPRFGRPRHRCDRCAVVVARTILGR
jgi:hypothetical protein